MIVSIRLASGTPENWRTVAPSRSSAVLTSACIVNAPALRRDKSSTSATIFPNRSACPTMISARAVASEPSAAMSWAMARIAVSGVRRSCDTDAIRMSFSRLASRSASACLTSCESVSISSACLRARSASVLALASNVLATSAVDRNATSASRSLGSPTVSVSNGGWKK